MIRISGVIAACATVNISGKEGRLIMLNSIPAAIMALLAVIAALTVNTCAYTPSFTVTGDDILSSPVFSVRISAMITETQTEETTSPEMTEGETVSTDEITDTDSGTSSVSAPAEDIPAVISDAVSEDVTNVDTVTKNVAEKVLAAKAK